MQSSRCQQFSPEFLNAFRQAAPEGILTVYDFVELALYHPQCGYYTAKKERVGRSNHTDFYTSSSIGSIFANLVQHAACERLRQENIDPSQYHFVEIGSEPTQGIVRHFSKAPFAETSTRSLGQNLEIPPKAIVFSNELFDAQPFQRFQWKTGKYRPMGVKLVDKEFTFSLLNDSFLEPFTPYLKDIPQAPSEDYLLDLPIGSSKLLQTIASKTWSGLFIAFDYGLSADSLYFQRPKGTARTYFNHQMSDNFLSLPGEQDITHHVLWDDFTRLLQDSSFKNITLLSQEAFFMKNALSFISPIVSSTSKSISREKQSLIQLLHPHHMGAAFQVVSAFRP